MRPFLLRLAYIAWQLQIVALGFLHDAAAIGAMYRVGTQVTVLCVRSCHCICYDFARWIRLHFAMYRVLC